MTSSTQGKWNLRQVLLGVVVAGFAHIASAIDLTPEEIRGEETMKPVGVLQKRFFLKAMRPEIGLLAGAGLNEAYTNTALIGVRGAFFFKEWLGVEGQYIDASVSKSADRIALEKLRFLELDPPAGQDPKVVSPMPEVNPIYKMLDVTAVLAPFYGKLNFMDMLIVYSDIHVVAGMTQLETAAGQKMGITVGLGQRFYLSKLWSLRADVRDRIFSDERGGEDQLRHAWAFDIGASYFFR